jgi:arsenite oxidase small subunit
LFQRAESDPLQSEWTSDCCIILGTRIKVEEAERKGDAERDVPSTEKRSFLKVTLAISVLAAIGGIASVARAISAPAESEVTSGTTTSTETGTVSTSSVSNFSTTGSSGYPKTLVATLSSLQVDQPVYFNYPLNDQSEASILVKLGTAVTDGVGPDKDIIAYSQICQHLGCIYAFVPPGSSPQCNGSYSSPGPVGYCCCHGSVYDFTNDAKVLSGPAPRPVPRVVLEVDSSGNIYAIGMSGANIYGHSNGDLKD